MITKRLTENELRILIEKYYEGETSCEEERIIRLHLNNGVFEDLELTKEAEIQGVISHYISSDSVKVNKNKKSFIRIGISAITTIAAAVTLFFMYPNESDICVMYVYGEKVVSDDIVMNQVNSVISGLQVHETDFESQLSKIFNY